MTWQEQALAELQAKRDRIDAAMDAIRELGADAAAPATKGKKPARPTSASSEFDEEILAALQNGKTTRKAIVKVTKESTHQVGQSLKRLMAAGRVTTTGATNSLQYQPATT